MQHHRLSKADKLFYASLVCILMSGLVFMAYSGSEYRASQYKIEYESDAYDYGPRAESFITEYCSLETIEGLSLKERIGQMIMAKANLLNAESMCSSGIGGAYVEWSGSKGVYSSIVDRCKNTAEIPLFIAQDLEGYWNPFSNFHDFPSAEEMGMMNDEEVYNQGREMARLLKELGFNMDFAPVVDLSYGDDVWGGRSFSDDPYIVSAKAAAFIRGMQDQGIIAVAKHFPGKTVSIADTHRETASAEVGENDLMPFRAVADAGVKGVMLNHLATTGAVDTGGKPASVSAEAIGALRRFFDGLVMTDDLSMRGVTSYYDADLERCLRERGGCFQEENIKRMYIDAINAGNDLLLLTSTDDPESIQDVIGAIESAVRQGDIDEATIDTAVARLFEYKCELFGG